MFAKYKDLKSQKMFAKYNNLTSQRMFTKTKYKVRKKSIFLLQETVFQGFLNPKYDTSFSCLQF